MQTLQQYAVPPYNETAYNDHSCYASIHLTISESLFSETLNMIIRDVAVQYPKEKAKRNRMKERNLEEKIATPQLSDS